jgi:hypothetical protein
MFAILTDDWSQLPQSFLEVPLAGISCLSHLRLIPLATCGFLAADRFNTYQSLGWEGGRELEGSGRESVIGTCMHVYTLVCLAWALFPYVRLLHFVMHLRLQCSYK